MTQDQFIDSVEAAFAPLADRAMAVRMERYLLDRYVFIGLPAPTRREAVMALIAQPMASAQSLLGLAQALWKKPQREYRYTAIDLLVRHRRLLASSDIPALRELLETDSWWETVDGLTSVIGAVLRGSDRISGQAMMDQWVNDGNFWVRRAAMLHQLGWRLETDRHRLFDYAERLGPEKEFFIRKSIGWALRDFARWEPESVRQFVQCHIAILSPLTVREALKRLQVVKPDGASLPGTNSST
ncbi:MAG: DNA alkylation repair protein [Pseudomonadota bacterium]